MNGSDLFGSALRVTGLIVSLCGLDWLVRFSMGQLGYFTLERTDITFYLIMGVLQSAVGLYLMRGAPHFVRYAYHEETDIEGTNENSSSD